MSNQTEEEIVLFLYLTSFLGTSAASGPSLESESSLESSESDSPLLPNPTAIQANTKLLALVTQPTACREVEYAWIRNQCRVGKMHIPQHPHQANACKRLLHTYLQHWPMPRPHRPLYAVQIDPFCIHIDYSSYCPPRPPYRPRLAHLELSFRRRFFLCFSIHIDDCPLLST